MRKRNNYYNYSKVNTEPVPQVEEETKVDVPIEDAGQVEEPKIEEVQPVPVSNERYGIVTNCTMVNVRSKANPTSNILTTIPEKGRVTVFGEEDGYYKVKTNAIELGFIKKEFLQIV